MKEEIKDIEFKPLKELLSQENGISNKIETIYQRELEYIEFLGPIEHFLAFSYLNDRKLKDSDVIKALRNIKLNYEKDSSFFKNELEEGIMRTTSAALQYARKKITRHELFLVFSYIIWCIKNRDYLNDPRVYLKWLCNFFHMYNENEKKEFDEEYKKYQKEFGWSNEKLKVLKNEDFDLEPSLSDVVLSGIESLKEAEKFENEEARDEGSEK